jgi:hypothetical protein
MVLLRQQTEKIIFSALCRDCRSDFAECQLKLPGQSIAFISKMRFQAEEKKYNNGDLIKKYICKLFF